MVENLASLSCITKMDKVLHDCCKAYFLVGESCVR